MVSSEEDWFLAWLYPKLLSLPKVWKTLLHLFWWHPPKMLSLVKNSWKDLTFFSLLMFWLERTQQSVRGHLFNRQRSVHHLSSPEKKFSCDRTHNACCWIKNIMFFACVQKIGENSTEISAFYRISKPIYHLDKHTRPTEHSNLWFISQHL